MFGVVVIVSHCSEKVSDRGNLRKEVYFPCHALRREEVNKVPVVVF